MAGDVHAEVEDFLQKCRAEASSTKGKNAHKSVEENWGDGQPLKESYGGIQSLLVNYHTAVNNFNAGVKGGSFKGPEIKTALPTSAEYPGAMADFSTMEGFSNNKTALVTANEQLLAKYWSLVEEVMSHPITTGEGALELSAVTETHIPFYGLVSDKFDDLQSVVAAAVELKKAVDDFEEQIAAPDEAMNACGKDLGAVSVSEEGCEYLNTGGAIIEKYYFPWIDKLDCPPALVTAQAAAAADRAAAQHATAVANPGAVSQVVSFEGARDFKEQCFLLAKIFELAEYKKETIETTIVPKRLPYIAPPPGNSGSKGNACLMADGDPYAFVNRLTQHPHQKIFFDMHNKDISTLMPMIRLYKVNTEGANETQQEYTFQSNTTKAEIDETFKSKGKRGYGVGVKDFSFVYDGNNPFAAKKSIKAKLTIFANSFDELLKERLPPEPGDSLWSYIELALKTGKGTAATDMKGKTAAQIEEIENNLSKLDFRLKAIVGWAKPKGSLQHFGTWGVNEFGTVYKKEDLLDAIYDSHMTLNLTPVTHEFNLDDMGRVNFVIHYLAYVDDFFDQSGFNIFFDVDTNLKMLKRKLKYKTLTKSCEAAKVAEQKKLELKDKKVKLEKQKSLQSIIQKLFVLDRVKYIEIGYGELIQFESEGPYYELQQSSSIGDKIIDQSLLLGVTPALLKQYTDAQTNAFTSKTGPAAITELTFAIAASNPLHNTIPFFYVSDLMDAILGGIENKLEEMPKQISTLQFDDDINSTSSATVLSAEADPTINLEDIIAEKEKLELFAANFKKFRLLLGPLEIVNPKDGETSLFINFGDVPISVKYFVEWMTDKLLKKDESVYSLSKFLSDFFNDLIKNFLNDSNCFDGVAKQKARLNQSVITSYRSKGEARDEFTAAIQNQHPLASRGILKNMEQPVLNVSGESLLPDGGDGGIGREINYMVFYAGRTQPTELMKGSRSADEAKGIFHYMLGKNRGIVKKIDLSKTTSTGLREVRFEQEGYDGLEQLREVYDVNITTYANVKAWPGTYLYVDPSGWSPMTTDLDLTQLGIGGYCMIIRSEHTFGPGQAETKITAKWVASNDAKLTTTTTDEGKEKAAGAGAGTNSSVMCNFGKRKEGLMDKFLSMLKGNTGVGTNDGSTPSPGGTTP